MISKIAIPCGLLAVICITASPAYGGQAAVYDVHFKGALVATQVVQIAGTEQEAHVEASFSADLYVFIARHHVEEKVKARFDRNSGDVHSFESRIVDGMSWKEVRGEALEGGLLHITRNGPEGVATSLVARSDYDFNSLALYVVEPAKLSGSNNTVRVLDIASGEVLNYSRQAISESRTRERQHVPVTHLVWTRGDYTSHSWHPQDLVTLPDPIIRQNEMGEFEFKLVR